jgi:inward rectifier potassium channel
MHRRIRYRPAGADYDIHIVGARPAPLKDLYYALLTLSWPATFVVIAVGFLLVNACFALAFLRSGGIVHARPGSFLDAFYFSVQTMGTIGYGAMYPDTPLANAIVVFEAIVSLTLTALATGLVFAKFSRPTARLMFSDHVVVTPMHGVPTLMFRVGNARGNMIVDAQFRVVLSASEITAEGRHFYRIRDLPLARDRALSLSRSFNLMHPITEGSPLFGHTAASAAAAEVEIQVLVVGLDDTSMNTVHAAKLYLARDIVWNARLADILSEQSDGSLVLDLHKFHAIEPSQPAGPTDLAAAKR